MKHPNSLFGPATLCCALAGHTLALAGMEQPSVAGPSGTQLPEFSALGSVVEVRNRLAAGDAGVTAKLDVVDIEALPALLVYRAGELADSATRVEIGVDSWTSGPGSEGGAQDGLAEGTDLGQLADDVEDLLDSLGAFS